MNPEAVTILRTIFIVLLGGATAVGFLWLLFNGVLNSIVIYVLGFPISDKRIEEALKPRRLLYKERDKNDEYIIRTDLEGYNIEKIGYKYSIGVYYISHIGLIPRWSKWHRYIKCKDIPTLREYESIKESKRRRREQRLSVNTNRRIQ